MKPHLFRLFSLLLAAVMLTAFALPVSAANAAAQQSHITEITVTKAEILRKGAFKAIQAALNSAHYGATKDNIYRITVEAGSYNLRSVLHIYSNTTLSLRNVTLVRDREAMANMIRTGDDTPPDSGDSGYTGNVNIAVEGGILDGNGTSNTMVKVTHASRFRMTGTQLCNLKNAHMMEVAAVDGLDLRSCTFKDQTLAVGDVGYEAIQLDIPKDGHIIGCRSEALAVRNVHIEGCFFTNCPRGIGSHTQILNLPMENIVITNNTFRQMTSAAIQGENWKNVRITNNRIENTPRAIAIYSILGKAEGGFRASVLSREGGIKTKVSDSYQKPYNADIQIRGNRITDCGSVRDVYASYDPLAILIAGKTLKSAVKRNPDGSGGYPKGNYYINGVTVSGNSITTAGHGVYLENGRNAAVDNNSIKSTKNKLTNKTACPITGLSVNFNSVSGNTISASSFHGIELAKSAIKKITGNTVSGVAQDGIILEAVSKVTGKISGNTVTKAKRYGLNLRPKCAGGDVSGNIIYNCGKASIAWDTAYTKLGSNYYSIAEIASLSLDSQSITLGTDEKITLTPSYKPVNVIKQFNWSTADPQVVTVNGSGVVTARGYGETDVTVSAPNGKTASCHFKVMPAPHSVKLNATMLVIGAGETYDLDSKLPEGTVSYSITYTSNNPDAVKVNSRDGMVTGVAPGTATVVCKTYNGKHAACNVIVRQAPYDIWFDERTLTLGTGETCPLHIQLPEGSAAHHFDYQSDDEAVVTVDENGILTAHGTGEAVVSATAFNGTKALCYVTVKNAPASVGFAERSYSLQVGDTLQPTVIFDEDSASHALQFQSSDPDICRVDRDTGELTARKPGTVTITVKTYNRVFGSCEVITRVPRA